jgi:hypothetical protein
MSSFSFGSKSGTDVPIPSIADWVPRGLLPGPLLYPFSSNLRLIYSPIPKHIGVAGDPPLCRACAYLFSQSYTIGEQGGMMALNRKRLRTAAELGCYICVILYNAECNPYGLWQPDTPLVQRIRDVTVGRKLTDFSFWMSREREKVPSGCFNLNFNIGTDKMWLGVGIPFGHLDIWRLSLKLVPEKGVVCKFKFPLVSQLTLEQMWKRCHPECYQLLHRQNLLQLSVLNGLKLAKRTISRHAA